MNKQVLIGLSTLSLVTILSGVALSSSNSSAASASTATAAVKVAASCTLTSTGGGNYSATVPNGTSAEISGSTLSASCNDAGGFSLYAVGYSNDTIGNNNMIGQSTNIATNTSGTDSYWAMKINPTTGNTPTIDNSFDSFHIVPNTHTKVASYAGSTGTGSLSVNATYKANISSSQLAGNYLGKVKYTLVHPANEIPQQEIACEPGKICYNANTNIVEGQMGRQTPNSYSIQTGVRLWTPNFKRDGFGFAGWSDSYDYINNPDANIYGPTETIMVPEDYSSNGLSLYAVWIPSAGTIQNWNGCSNLTQDPHDGTADLSSITALTDERDGDTYAVARLVDGKCWTIENLRLSDKNANNNDVILSSNNTNNPSLPITNDYDNSIKSNHLSSPTDPTQTAWCYSDSAACIEKSMLATNNTTLFINNGSSNYDYQGDVYSYGNYYNWYSATAGHGTRSVLEYNSTTGDICPAGWHLPKGREENTNSTNEYWQLIVNGINNGVKPANNNYYSGDTETKALSAAIRAFPNNFVYAGAATQSIIASRSNNSAFQSSTAYGRATVSAMYVHSNDSIYPGTNSNTVYKFVGYSVRCIAST